MSETINILHLRASEGGGGGPEKTIFKTARHIDPKRFWYGTCYLRKHGTDLAAVASRYRTQGLPYFEIPGRIVDLRQLAAVAALIHRHGVHILHTHEAKSIVYGILLKHRFPRIRLITTLHGWVIRRRRSRGYQWIAETALKRYDAVIAVSDDLERKARQRGVRRVIRIHNAIDPGEWPPVHKADTEGGRPFTVGYVGRLSREKGPEQFLRVARRLAAVDADIRFRMVGQGPMAPWVRREITRLGLDDRVIHTGYVPQDRMPAVYGELDVLLSSSHTEGMPNTLLEAFACGVPVVATRVGGVEELVSHGHNGFLASDGDTLSLARSVLTLRHRPGLAQRTRDRARERMLERFTFTKRVAAIERLYETQAGKGSP